MIYKTIILKNENNFDKLIDIVDYFIDLKYKVWYLYKENNIRLRVLIKDEIKIKKILVKNKISFIESVYEPEFYLFGGEKNIDKIHNIFVEFCKISIKIYKNKLINDYDPIILKIKLLDIYVKSFEVDKFEEWDIWRKVSEKRMLLKETRKNLILNNLQQIYSSLIIDEKNILNLEEVKTIKKTIKKIRNNKNELLNGYRSVISHTIIFIMNILAMTNKEQLAIVNLYSFIKNPDFRMEFE